MLVHKKQEWDYEYENQPALPQFKPSRFQEERSFASGQINWPLRSKCLLIVLTVAFFAAVVTAHSAHIVKSGYNLVEAKREVMRLEKANELLKLDIARLKTHERIAQIASQKLGMIIPQNAYFSSIAAPYEPNAHFEPPAAEKNALTGLLDISFSANSTLEKER